jgi:hypothetical protein
MANKTKEEILKDVVEKSNIRYFKSDTQYMVDAEHAYKAMEAYANQARQEAFEAARKEVKQWNPKLDHFKYPTYESYLNSLK